MLAFAIWSGGSTASFADEPAQVQPEQTDTSPNSDALPPPVVEPMPVPVAAPQQRKPLQGRLEQNAMPTGITGINLNGGVQAGAPGTGLMGGVEGGGWAGNAQQGMIDQSRPGPLQGGAGQNPLALGVQNDPDAADQELQIDWDMWRNTLMQAIQAATVAKINVHNDINFVWDPQKQMMMSRYPNGISTWYSLDVLPDRRIVNIRLVSSSRYQGFDQAVMQSIAELQGNNILTYPPRSKRRIVTQQSCVSTAPVSQTQQFQFGDVERQRY